MRVQARITDALPSAADTKEHEAGLNSWLALACITITHRSRRIGRTNAPDIKLTPPVVIRVRNSFPPPILS